MSRQLHFVLPVSPVKASCISYIAILPDDMVLMVLLL
jgi:hypothetical protein